MAQHEIDTVSGGWLEDVTIAGTGGAAFAIGGSYTVALIGAAALGFGVGSMIYAGFSNWYY